MYLFQVSTQQQFIAPSAQSQEHNNLQNTCSVKEEPPQSYFSIDQADRAIKMSPSQWSPEDREFLLSTPTPASYPDFPPNDQISTPGDIKTSPGPDSRPEIDGPIVAQTTTTSLGIHTYMHVIIQHAGTTRCDFFTNTKYSMFRL